MKKYYIVLSSDDVDDAYFLNYKLSTAVRACEKVAEKKGVKAAYVFSLVTRCEFVGNEARWDDAE